LAIDQEIVQVSCTENIGVRAKGFIDKLLECCRCICESKGHDQGFKEATASVYGSIQEIFISYPDKVVGLMNVNFGEIFCLG
jgi:hypothetical protein